MDFSEKFKKQRDLDAYSKNKEEQDSLDRQTQSRNVRRAKRNIRKIEKSYLAQATSTEQRRKIKQLADEAEEKALYDLGVEYKPKVNKSDYESDIQQKGVDSFKSPDLQPEGSDNGIESFEEETLDIVDDNNSAAQRIFLTKQT